MEPALVGYRTELEPALPRDGYAAAGESGGNWGHCRNFLALARQKALPTPTLEMLDALGIPPEKATYVGELYTDEAGIHYQFSYRLAGRILSAPEQDDTAPHAGRCCHEPYPYGAPGFPAPHFDLEFYATLPWLPEEPAD